LPEDEDLLDRTRTSNPAHSFGQESRIDSKSGILKRSWWRRYDVAPEKFAFYGIAYISLFAIPLFALKNRSLRGPVWMRFLTVSGLALTLLFVLLSVFPFIPVASESRYTLKTIAVLVLANLCGLLIYRLTPPRPRPRNRRAPERDTLVLCWPIERQKGEPMGYFALFYEVVDDFVARRTPFREQHLGLARLAQQRGELLLAGALAEPAGALIIFRGDSSDVAKSFAESDPYVRNGLVKHWKVRPWAVVVGGDANVSEPISGSRLK
jgi:uncharacterized protein YciI